MKFLTFVFVIFLQESQVSLSGPDPAPWLSQSRSHTWPTHADEYPGMYAIKYCIIKLCLIILLQRLINPI